MRNSEIRDWSKATQSLHTQKVTILIILDSLSLNESKDLLDKKRI